jgi:hypothetical protein
MAEEFHIRMDKIKTDLYKVSLELSQLKSYIKSVETVITHIETASEYLNELDELLESLDSTLKAISIIPIIKPEIDFVDKIIHSTKLVIDQPQKSLMIMCHIYATPTKKELQLFETKINNMNNTISVLIDDIILFENRIGNLCSKNLNIILDRYGFVIGNIDTILFNISSAIHAINEKTKLMHEKCQFMITLYQDIEFIHNKFLYVSQTVNPIHQMLNEKIIVSTIDDTSYVIALWNYITSFIWKEVGSVTYTICQIFTGLDDVTELIVIALEQEAIKILKPVVEQINLRIEFPHPSCLNFLEENMEAIAELTTLSHIDKIEKYMKDISNEIAILNN